MTYREVADRCGQFYDPTLDFSHEVDTWEDFFVLYDDKYGYSAEENLLDRLSCEVVQVKRIVDKLDFKDNYQLRTTVALMLSDFRRIKSVLQARPTEEEGRERPPSLRLRHSPPAGHHRRVQPLVLRGD